jgi:lysophospholipase L1-like esterase
MMSTTRIILLIVGIILLGACAAVPVPYATTATGNTVPKIVHTVWGDSLSWQATGYPGQQNFELYGRYWHVRPGNSLAQLKQEILEDLGRRPDFMTLALGTNDAGHWDGRDGWTAEDEAAWYEVLSARGDTKITIVLPWIQVGNDVNQEDVNSVYQAREFLANLEGVTIIDWGAYVQADTLDPGGIHVAAGAMDPL